MIDDGRAIAEVARNIGVSEMTLGKWVKRARDSGQASDKPLEENEREELEQLRAEVKQLRMENEFANYAAVTVMPMFG